MGSLLNDTSPYALQRGDPGRLRRLCAAVFDPSFDNSKSAAKMETRMKMWQAYTVEMGTDCWRPDAADLNSFGRKRETVLCAGFLQLGGDVRRRGRRRRRPRAAAAGPRHERRNLRAATLGTKFAFCVYTCLPLCLLLFYHIKQTRTNRTVGEGVSCAAVLPVRLAPWLNVKTSY